MTKADFAVFQERLDGRLKETEFRLITRLGFLTVSAVSLAVAMLAWLTKVQPH